MSLDPIFAGGSNVSIGGVPIDLRYKDSMNTKRESDADQSNSLDGSISANVMQVLNNGSLVIRGENGFQLIMVMSLFVSLVSFARRTLNPITLSIQREWLMPVSNTVAQALSQMLKKWAG